MADNVFNDEAIIQRQRWVRGPQPVPVNLPPGKSGPGLFPVIRVGVSQISPQIAPVLFVPQPNPTTVPTVVFDVLFLEPVIGFTVASIVIGGTALPTTAVILPAGVNADNAHFIVQVSGMTVTGTVTLEIPARAVRNGAGVENQAAFLEQNSVDFVVVSPPPVSILLSVLLTSGLERFNVVSSPPDFNLSFLGTGNPFDRINKLVSAAVGTDYLVELQSVSGAISIDFPPPPSVTVLDPLNSIFSFTVLDPLTIPCTASGSGL